MLFTIIMRQLCSDKIKLVFTFFLLIVTISCHNSDELDFSERTKIALRDAGNKLLLTRNDSTSLIFPVKELEPKNFQLTFSRPLQFEPGILVSTIEESFNAIGLLDHYRVEVLQCEDREVAYSYQMTNSQESTIIPCAGRYLPEACYFIQVKFIDKSIATESHNTIMYSITLVLLFVIIYFLYKRTRRVRTEDNHEIIQKIGSFSFYPDQNKLVKEAQVIALSKKECELLALFVAHPNQIIKRDELTKRVWEDNGVFVGRSLDTYISKLRKKLKSDSSIKLTNAHGIGYKLELE